LHTACFDRPSELATVRENPCPVGLNASTVYRYQSYSLLTASVAGVNKGYHTGLPYHAQLTPLDVDLSCSCPAISAAN